MNTNRCQIIELPNIVDDRGKLIFLEAERHVPFEVKRIFYLVDIVNGKSRGGHAHKNLEQFILPISGSFDVIIDDGKNRGRFFLNKSNFGLYLPPMTWCNLHNFSVGAVCMVLASDYYDESDYYRVYDDFLLALQEANK